MNVVIAMDSFKGSMTSLEAGQAAAEGIRRIYPEATIHVRPVADGGEGTVEALIEGMDGIRERAVVTGPLGDPVNACYGILRRSGTAILEMSAAAGITLVPPEKRNPMRTTTYGVGEMIADAIRKNCRNFIIGIGGSATNDGGIGMLQALGYRFLDRKGQDIPKGAEGLASLYSIDFSEKHPALEDCRFQIACDVTNPLCGEKGCSAIFGPQKGADTEMVQQMDSAMLHYAATVKKYIPQADANLPGSGAAGGLGFAFRTFLKGRLQPGAELILRQTDLESYIRNADIVLTGEGCLDGQTSFGKAPGGVAALAYKYGKTVIALAGTVKRDAASCHGSRIHAYFPILREVISLDEAMRPEIAKANMRDTAEHLFRLIYAMKG